jgi:membrane-associated protein
LEILSDFLKLFTTPEGFKQMITWGGYPVLCLIIFSETGLLIGFFLPGDSLLVTAGLLSSAGYLNISYLILLLIPCAIIGDALGYYIGKKGGRKLYDRPESRFFKKVHLEKTTAFYQKHGGKTIILARFIPLLRTFAPVVAGISGMEYKKFAVFNVVGGIFWICSTTLLGYFLGNLIPNIEKYIHYVIAVVIVFSLLPIVYELIKNKRSKSV